MDDTPDEASCSISKVGRIVLNAELKSINKALAYEFGFSRGSITLWVNMIVASSVHFFFLKVGNKKLEWKPVITPADSYTLDSRPMEGMTYLEHPAPVVYLDSWLMKGASCPRPHVDWEVLNGKPSLNNVTIVKMVDTDASDDVNTHLPDKVTPMSTPMTDPAWPCVDSPRLPTVKHEIVNRMKDTREMKMTLPENARPTIDPNMTRKNSPEYFTPVSTPMTAPV